MPEWNGSAGQEAALQAMVERANDIIEKKGEGVCICDLFEQARYRAQSVYLKTPEMGPNARMDEQARENALWGARGVIDGAYSGSGTDGAGDPNDLVANIVRGNEDPDDGALWAIVKRADAIKGIVSGRELCELYRVARTASREATRPSRNNATSGQTPVADPAKSERAACQAIDQYLEGLDETTRSLSSP